MSETKVIFCSDVQLCHLDWYGRSSADRMENMIDTFNRLFEEKPYEKIVFLGDYSLDFWKWDIGGSVLREGVSNTDNFVKHYAKRLKADYYMAPGNHDLYGYESWKKITGTDRDDAFVVGGYLIISCDNFSGVLEPDFHSDGIYTPTKLEFIREKMAEYPEVPVILCGHFFDKTKEPEAFFEFLKQEKRITLLICGHDHVVAIEDLGERAGNVSIYHDGHYSYSGIEHDGTPEFMWGFCEAVLSDEGIEIAYVEPANTIMVQDIPMEHTYRERQRRFFRRRDLES